VKSKRLSIICQSGKGKWEALPHLACLSPLDLGDATNESKEWGLGGLGVIKGPAFLDARKLEYVKLFCLSFV
jgi:hypothetical protein